MNLYLRKIIKKSIQYAPRVLYPVYISFLEQKLLPLKLNKGIFLISFDNDYSADIEAAQTLFPIFKRANIKINWASVGKWVEKYEDFHKELIYAGHEIINHSWSHPDNYELRPEDSRKFDQISEDEVEFEISKMHFLLLEKFNYTIEGFRMPHFRTHPNISKTLKKLNYKYTSNHFALNSPSFGIPYITTNKMVEFPLSGIPRQPNRIVESYRLFRSPDGLYLNETVFYKDFLELIKVTEEHKLITNIYLDACDMVRLSNPKFETYIKNLIKANIDIFTYRELTKLILKNNL